MSTLTPTILTPGLLAPPDLVPPDLDAPRGTPFSVESGAVMQRLRTAVADMIKGLPTRVRTTRDLQKAFGVDVKLCWQVLKLAGPGDALALAAFVPTPGPMRRFLAAASAAGVDRAGVDRIGAAYEAFQEQVSIHAGDRVTFQTMATGSADLHERANDDLQKAAVRLRKSAFQTASHYAGAQLDTYLGLSIVAPAATPGRVDAAFLRVKLGVRRLRPTVTLNVDSTKLVASDAGVEAYRDTFQKTTFDDEAAERYGASILPRFSTRPLPQFTTAWDAHGTSHTRVAGDSVGQRSAVDLVFGQAVRDAPLTELYGGTKRGFATSLDVTTPAAVVILDKLVHRPTFPHLQAEFSAHWMCGAGGTPADAAPGLPFAERVHRLDAGVDGARTHEVPNYVEMVEFVCDRCGWRMDEFDVYRVRVEYPLHFSRLWTKFVPVASPAG